MRLQTLDDLFLDTLDAMVELLDEEEGLRADDDSTGTPIPDEKLPRMAAAGDQQL